MYLIYLYSYIAYSNQTGTFSWDLFQFVSLVYWRALNCRNSISSGYGFTGVK